MSDQIETPKETPTVDEFLLIKNYEDKVLYTCTVEELEEVLISILSAGVYTKTFTLFNGKIELTYQSITDEERNKGYELIRTYTETNKDKLSRIQLDNYTSKVNLALQLVRIKTNGIGTNMQQGDLDERILLLTGQPEELLRLCSEKLAVFANITSKAFVSEDAIKK